MPTICSYINPFSNDFHALDDFKRLTCPQKVGIVVVTTVLACSIIFSILAVPVFRYLVGRCINQLSEGALALRVLRTGPSELSEDTYKRVKHIFVCKVAERQKAFEIDMGLGNERIGSSAIKWFWSQSQEKLNGIEQWLSQRAEVQGKIYIKRITFYLDEKGNAPLSSMSVDYDSYEKYIKDNSTSSQYSNYTVHHGTDERTIEVFRAYAEELGLVVSKQIQTVDDFFNGTIIQPSAPPTKALQPAVNRAEHLMERAWSILTEAVVPFFKQGEAARVNHFCICKIGTIREAFDIDLGKKVQAHDVVQTTKEAMGPIKNWLAKKLSKDGLEQTCKITGLSVYVSDKDVDHAAVWWVKDSSTAKSGVGNDSFENVKKKDMARVLQSYMEKYRLDIPNAELWQTFSNRLALEH